MILLIALLLGGYVFFVKTGGMGLSRVTWHYFFRDLPDKKYSWQEFTDRGTAQGISGFYAFGNQNGFSMWTLSGLKTFRHVPGTSIYQHEDICGALKALQDNLQATGSGMKANKQVTGVIEFWQSLMKQENLVTVLRLTDGEHHNDIDKVWSYSGKYRVLNKLDPGVCD
ncbi:MAG: hypothetical protein IPG44_20915 [Anaerolineales bacterium]|nr:hypothetical protein [Anaerolineales bacterium]